LVPLLAVVLCAPGLRAQTTSNSPPAWWVAHGLLDGLPTDPNAQVTLGQVYQFAAAAAAELAAKLPPPGTSVSGAGGAIDALAPQWGNQPQPGFLGRYYASYYDYGIPNYYDWARLLLRHETANLTGSGVPGAVDFDWGAASPGPGVPMWDFSAIWTGTLVPPATGNYLIETETAGWAQLWLGDSLLVNRQNLNGLAPGLGGGALLQTTRAVVALTAGVPVDLQLNYAAHGAAAAHLRWVPTAGRSPQADTAIGLAATYYDAEWNPLPIGTGEGEAPPEAIMYAAFDGSFAVLGSDDYAFGGDTEWGALSFYVDGNPVTDPTVWLEAGVHSLRIVLDNQANAAPGNYDGNLAYFYQAGVELGWWLSLGGGSWLLPMQDTAGNFLPGFGEGPHGSALPADWIANRGTDSGGRPVLRAAYFDGQGRPLIVRDEAADFNWGAGAPDPAVPAGQFAARWSGLVSVPADGWYVPVRQVGSSGADSLNLWIDGQVVPGMDGRHSGAENRPVPAAPVWLAAGEHLVVLAYRHCPIWPGWLTLADVLPGDPGHLLRLASAYPYGDPGTAAVHWALVPATEAQPALPDWANQPPGAAGANGAALSLPGPAANTLVSGLRGEYFADDQSTVPLLVRNEAPDLFWGLDSPGGLVPADRFFVRWTGWLTPTVTGEHWLEFALSAGWATLELDGQWALDSSVPFNTVALTVGVPVPVSLTYAFDRTNYENPATQPAGLSLSLGRMVWVAQDELWVPGPAVAGAFSSPDGGTGALGASPVRLRAEHFANSNLSGAPTLARDEVADFSSGLTGSARWSGDFMLLEPGLYVLAREAGGPLRISIDGWKLADDWAAPPVSATFSFPVWLEAGPHIIELEAAAGGDGRLHWALCPVFTGLPDWTGAEDTGYYGPGLVPMAGPEVTSRWGDEALRNTLALQSLTSVRGIVDLFRTRLTAVGWRDFPADTTGNNAWTDTTVAGLKRLFGFDLDRDDDGDGRAFWEELAAGTDPYDYFNGQVPVIVSIEGGDQTAPPGHFAAYPWTVRVRTADGIPFINAPVTFSLPDGDSGLLSARSDGSTPLVRTLSVRTDAAGYAWVYIMPEP
jgi:hypothetical protein